MFAVIDRRTEEQIKVYDTFKGAAIAMRALNKQEGFAERVSRCWTMGLAIEWCRTTNDKYDYGPYAIGGQIHHVG
jgi:hypothetical protein